MVFSSTIFLFLFLPVVLLAYHAAPRSGKNAVLVGASLLFYFWGERFFVAVMLASILANYGFGLAVERYRGRAGARAVVALAVAANLGLLVAYKYSGFLLENLNLGLAAAGLDPVALALPAHLPIGISFFTFQALSYVVDVFRGEAEVQRSPFRLSLYISLFPQLVAGPIVRYREIEAQLAERRVDLARMGLGVQRFVIGLGKKVLLATPLEAPVASVFDELPLAELTLPIAWLGVFAYMLQLYFDFSGYSDMAIGLGHMLGFRFPENFRYPFAARSVRELWTRWHVSLTRWFRDYVYVPLGGNRAGAWRTYRNLLVVFVLCGLWHGASWNFVVFGLFHGVFLVLERFPALAFLGRGPRLLQHVYVLGAWLFGLALFRGHGVDQAVALWGAMLGFAEGGSRSVTEFLTPEVLATLPVAFVASLPVLPWLARRLEGRTLAAPAGVVATAATCGVFVLSAVYLAASTHHPFIYFRF